MILCANEQHIKPIVQVHIASFPNSFLTKLGSGVLRIIYEEMSKPPLGFCWVYVQNDQVLGFISGSYVPTGQFYKHIFGKRFWSLGVALIVRVVQYPWILSGLMRRAASVFSDRKPHHEELLSSPPAGKIVHILSVASSPTFRRQGIGLSLLRTAMDKLRTENYDCIHIAFLADNIAAKRLYENVGFVPFKRSQSTDGATGLYYKLSLKSN